MPSINKAYSHYRQYGLVSLMREIRRFYSHKSIVTTNKSEQCSVCDSDDISLFIKEEPSSLYVCNKCQLIFYNPLPTDTVLMEYYSSENGYLPSIRDTMEFYHTNYENRKERFDKFLNAIKKYKQGFKSILDIGCGYGFFLEHCRRQGHDAYGIEISKMTSQWANENNLNVYNGILSNAPYESNFFEVITSFHCLEHALDPNEEISNIYNLCAPGGIFLLAVPNAGSLVAEKCFERWKWKSWPNHLYYFNQHNLRVLLEKYNFRVLETYSQAGDSDVNDDLQALGKSDGHRGNSELINELKYAYAQNKGQELVVICQKPPMENSI